jgi:hypothetical protein
MSRQHLIFIRSLAIAAVALAACSESAPLELEPPLAPGSEFADPIALQSPSSVRAHSDVLAQIRRATARYHDVNAALADGFIPVGECEVEEGEHPGGIPYANLEYLFDGQIDPSKPDALLYEPGSNGRLRLVGAELAVPYPMWTATEPPQFLGETFRREDEMGVFGLHIWLWRNNPDGMFAWGNPLVSCEAEA